MSNPKHVVCINDNWTDGYGPRKNDILEVTGTINGFVFGTNTQAIGFTLKEFPTPHPTPYGTVIGFVSKYFRPVDDTFGPLVEEIISKQVEVEEFEKISA